MSSDAGSSRSIASHCLAAFCVKLDRISQSKQLCSPWAFLAYVAVCMAHFRVMSSHLSSSASAVHHRRVCEGSQAELRTVAGRSQPCISSSCRAPHSAPLLCLPRHLAAAPARPSPGATLSQPLTACAAYSFQTPALVPVREVSESAELKPLPRAVENVADDPSLANPLARQNRLNTAWMGVSFPCERSILSCWPSTKTSEVVITSACSWLGSMSEFWLSDRA